MDKKDNPELNVSVEQARVTPISGKTLTPTSTNGLRTREATLTTEEGIELPAIPGSAGLGLPAEEGLQIRQGTIRTKWQERTAIAALWWCLFMAGWNDASTGPLLPRIQENYNVNFTVVSIIFICNFIGFTSAAVLNVRLTDWWGFGATITLGAAAQVVAYALDTPAPPYPLFCIAFIINGFGIGLQDAQANTFVASLPDADTKMGWLHAWYGMGALVAPLIATQFAQLQRWSFHYLVSLIISITNLIVLILVFRFKTQGDLLGITQHHIDDAQIPGNKYKRMFKLKILHLLAFFALVYVGLEVTIGGWIVTYIIDVRGGSAASGYVSSGFFGGLTLGRVLLLWVNKKIGPKYVVIMYCLLCIALEIVIWFVRSIIGDALSVSIVGLLLGPIYPIIMNVSSRILPRSLLAGCIGWIASFGQVGSAVFPFITGALSQHFGVQVLEPILVGMLALLILLWAMVPTRPKADD
ncbi:MFS general substrate transporter [Calocera cornea HHB12733]|uniref:MFS general substrate transporter n=1 Tax=Calocera cornea HHB12733 TaxID=1353952 RepID=A0A165KBY4_9BASI|nr:MFS general substrate transporter [Calocera cornea HHB12733]